MSSSPSRGLAAFEGDQSAPVSRAQPFPYAAVPPSASRMAAISGLAENQINGPTQNPVAEAVAREQQARAQGRQEGQAEAEKVFAKQLERERAALKAALAQFTRDRAAYFQKVEGEVVHLALSIARKILHREAQMDPLLLAAIVRVALEKIDGATGVVLRVHPDNAADWRRYLATHLEQADLPEIVEDISQPPDHCVLETAMGIASVGLEAQFKEIEQGLMDLLAARPEAPPGAQS
jgi:flagellar assembly protein FliH